MKFYIANKIFTTLSLILLMRFPTSWPALLLQFTPVLLPFHGSLYALLYPNNHYRELIPYPQSLPIAPTICTSAAMVAIPTLTLEATKEKSMNITIANEENYSVIANFCLEESISRERHRSINATAKVIPSTIFVDATHHRPPPTPIESRSLTGTNGYSTAAAASHTRGRGLTELTSQMNPTSSTPPPKPPDNFLVLPPPLPPISPNPCFETVDFTMFPPPQKPPEVGLAGPSVSPPPPEPPNPSHQTVVSATSLRLFIRSNTGAPPFLVCDSQETPPPFDQQSENKETSGTLNDPQSYDVAKFLFITHPCLSLHAIHVPSLISSTVSASFFDLRYRNISSFTQQIVFCTNSNAPLLADRSSKLTEFLTSTCNCNTPHDLLLPVVNEIGIIKASQDNMVSYAKSLVLFSDFPQECAHCLLFNTYYNLKIFGKDFIVKEQLLFYAQIANSIVFEKCLGATDDILIPFAYILSACLAILIDYWQSQCVAARVKWQGFIVVATSCEVWKDWKNLYNLEDKVGPRGVSDDIIHCVSVQCLLAKKIHNKGTMSYNAVEVEAKGNIMNKKIVRLWYCCNNLDKKLVNYAYIPRESLAFILKKNLKSWPNNRYKNGIDTVEGFFCLHHVYASVIAHPFITNRVAKFNMYLDGVLVPPVANLGAAKIFLGISKEAQSMIGTVGCYGYIAILQKEQQWDPGDHLEDYYFTMDEVEQQWNQQYAHIDSPITASVAFLTFFSLEHLSNPFVFPTLGRGAAVLVSLLGEICYFSLIIKIIGLFSFKQWDPVCRHISYHKLEKDCSYNSKNYPFLCSFFCASQ